MAAAGLLGGMNPIGLGLSLAPEVFRLFASAAQKRKARAINPVDPGFQANTEVVDNARKVNDLYTNYQLPGKTGIVNNLKSNFAGGMDVATQGASSSGDVLDAVTKLNNNQNDAVAGLSIQEAQMKQAMLPQVLAANEARGNELVRKNEFDNQRYEDKMREKAALNNASAVNGFTVADNIATVGGSLLNYNSGASDKATLDPAVIQKIMKHYNKTGKIQ